MEERLSIDGVEFSTNSFVVASGGLAAPMTPFYDLMAGYFREPWLYADHPCWLRDDRDGERTRAWLFPRWSRLENHKREAQHRLRWAWRAVRHGVPPEREDDW